MKSKGVALIVAVLLVWTMVLPATAAVNPFSDVRSDHWAYEAIVKLASQGLVEGYPDGTFGGDRSFTRYEMAMVFARILARFESLIDEQISEGIDAKAERLAQDIQHTRETLAAKIDSDFDVLSAEIDALAARVGALDGGADVSAALAGTGASSLREVLAEYAADDLAELLRMLRMDMTDLARRVLRLEGRTPSRAEATIIAERVVADALAEFTGDPDAALGAVASGSAQAAARLIESRVDNLADTVARLTDEFRPELNTLGLQVTDLEIRMGLLERRMARQETQVADLRERIGHIRLTGKNVTKLESTSVTDGDDVPIGGSHHVDPRDTDSDTYSSGDSFTNAFTLGLTANPVNNVEIAAELTLINDVFGGSSGTAIDPKLNLDLTTRGVIRRVHVGDLDKGDVASGFDKYTLHADTFGDGNGGAEGELVWGRDDGAHLYGFVTRQASNHYGIGMALSYELSPAFDLTFRNVRDTDPLGDWVTSISSEGQIEQVEYSAMYAVNRFHTALKGTALDVSIQAPINQARLDIEHAAVEAGFNPNISKVLESHDAGIGPDWVDRRLHPKDDKVQRGESDTALTFTTPLLGLEAQLVAGERDDAAGDNKYVQGVLSGLNVGGVEGSILYDLRTDEWQDTDRTLGVKVGAEVLGADVDVATIYRTNDQAWAGVSEDQQRHTWVTASYEIDAPLPVSLDARYGMSRSAPVDSHTFVGVNLNDMAVGPVAVRAGYSTSVNDVDADHWWINSKWSSDKVDTLTAGLGYTFPGFFGMDLKTDYEYKLVYLNNSVDGSARNTFTASFEKELGRGEATLSGEGKYVTGGTVGEDGNDQDISVKADLLYPIFANGDLKFGGLYTSSLGSKAAEYKLYHLNAGLEISF